MTDSITVMNNLSSRIIPGSIEDTVEYYDTISLFDGPSTSFKALLLANLEKLGESAIKWGVERSGKSRSYINHLLRIGRVIIGTEDKAFEILRDFSYDKYLELLTLPKKNIPKFVLSRGKKLIKMTRDELRKEIYDILGKEPKVKNDKYQPDMFEAIDAFLEVDDSKLDNLYMDERFNGSTVSKYYKSGMILVENVVNYLNVRGGNPEVIATAEQQLRAQADKLAEIRERMTLKEVS